MQYYPLKDTATGEYWKLKVANERLKLEENTQAESKPNPIINDKDGTTTWVLSAENGILTLTDTTSQPDTQFYLCDTAGDTWRVVVEHGIIGIERIYGEGQTVLKLSHHPLDVRSNRWADLSRLGNHGIPYGGARPVMIAPRIWGFEFDKVDDYVNCGNSENLSVGGKITTGAWIYPKSLGENSYGHIIGRGSVSGWVFYLYPGSKLKFYGSSGAIDVTSDTNVIVLNQWQYVIVTYDSINDKNIRFFVDGMERGTVSETESIVNTGFCIIGARTTTGQYVFDGVIAQPIIENRAWSQDEIRENMYRSPIYRMLRGLPRSFVYINVPWNQDYLIK